LKGYFFILLNEFLAVSTSIWTLCCYNHQ